MLKSSKKTKKFSEIIENAKEVSKWLRPASKQFNIWYNNNSDRYVPDFVAETEKVIYLIEIKAENELEDQIVKMKEQAAINYCKNASEINKARKEKAWKYVIIPGNKTDANMTFMKLVTELFFDISIICLFCCIIICLNSEFSFIKYFINSTDSFCSFVSLFSISFSRHFFLCLHKPELSLYVFPHTHSSLGIFGDFLNN